MGLIGYTSPYIPVELIAATGRRPYYLMNANSQLSQQGEKYLRIDACPYIKSMVAYVIEHEQEFSALIGATGCDMMRRSFEVIQKHTSIPVYVLNVPRTDYYKLYSDEIDWLIKELEILFSIKLSSTMIKQEIEKWQNYRNEFQHLERMRAAVPSKLSSTTLYTRTLNYYRGSFKKINTISPEPSQKPRVYLISGEFVTGLGELLAHIENTVRIVGDCASGLSEFLLLNIKKNNLDGLKQAYFNQAHIYRRPNQNYFTIIAQQLQELSCQAIIALTLDYCDSYEFEIKRMRSTFKLPLLHIKTDLSLQNISQIKTRLMAFGEIL